ncbi:hypothetical protein ACFWR9_37745 [Streptomyces sp. NPDC058534]|uniref:hypothetical protein n=1 Tax=Streptomyces sp. NPDC058534 TaxID=3346541 RepID=UPI0036549467
MRVGTITPRRASTSLGNIDPQAGVQALTGTVAQAQSLGAVPVLGQATELLR